MDKITKQTFKYGVPYALGINKKGQPEVIFQQKVNNDWTDSGVSYRYAAAVLTGNEEMPIGLKKAKTSKFQLKLPTDYDLYNSDEVDPNAKEAADWMATEIKGYDDNQLEQIYNAKKYSMPKKSTSPAGPKKTIVRNPFSFYNKLYNFKNSSTYVLKDQEGKPVGVVFERQQQAIDRPEKGLVYMENGQIKFTGSVASQTFDRTMRKLGLSQTFSLFYHSDAEVKISDNPDINEGTTAFLKKIAEIIDNGEKPKASSFNDFVPNDELFKTYIDPLIQERKKQNKRNKKQGQPKEEPKISSEPSLTSSQKNVLHEFKALFPNVEPVAQEIINFIQNFNKKEKVIDEETNEVKEKEFTLKEKFIKKRELFNTMKKKLEQDSPKIVEAKEHLKAMASFTLQYENNPSNSLSSFIDGLNALIAFKQKKQQDLSELGVAPSHPRTTRQSPTKDQSRTQRLKTKMM